MKVSYMLNLSLIPNAYFEFRFAFILNFYKDFILYKFPRSTYKSVIYQWYKLIIDQALPRLPKNSVGFLCNNFWLQESILMTLDVIIPVVST